MAIYNGTSAADTLSGSAGNVNDVLNGGLGNDLYRYSLGSGNDVINDTGGWDTLQLDDPLYLFREGYAYRSGNNLVGGFNGQGRVTVKDQFLGLPVVEVLAFEDDGIPFFFSNSLTGSVSNDILIGTSSAESITGNGGNDLMSGNEGNDLLNGGGGNDFLSGGADSDTLVGGAGNDTMIGGNGSDTYHVRNVGDIVRETNATASTGGTDLVMSYMSSYTLGTNVENGRILATGAANLTGNSLANVLYAGVGNNVLNGSTGTDTASYAYATAGVQVNLTLTSAQATGGSGSDRLVGIETLTGSAYADRLTGNSAANVLDGSAGSDTMIGGNGSDTYYLRNVGDIVRETNATESTGGTDLVMSYLSSYTLGTNVENGRILATGAANLTGNSLANVLYAGVGNNVLNGSTGTDTASYAYATAGVQVNLTFTSAQATGGSGSDRLVGIEKLTGSAYTDRLTGNSGANTLDGGTGNDFLTGGAGKDLLIGGTGRDTFDFNSLSEMGITSATRDVISDFVRGLDKIDLSTLDANAALAGNQAFSAPVVGGTFSGAFANAGDLYFDNGAHVLYGNADADAAAEFAIQLLGVNTLAATDLFL
jgi:Ca2+-binding RTX toxin-like protein